MCLIRIGPRPAVGRGVRFDALLGCANGRVRLLRSARECPRPRCRLSGGEAKFQIAEPLPPGVFSRSPAAPGLAQTRGWSTDGTRLRTALALDVGWASGRLPPSRAELTPAPSVAWPQAVGSSPAAAGARRSAASFGRDHVYVGADEARRRGHCLRHVRDVALVLHDGRRRPQGRHHPRSVRLGGRLRELSLWEMDQGAARGRPEVRSGVRGAHVLGHLGRTGAKSEEGGRPQTWQGSSSHTERGLGEASVPPAPFDVAFPDPRLGPRVSGWNESILWIETSFRAGRVQRQSTL